MKDTLAAQGRKGCRSVTLDCIGDKPGRVQRLLLVMMFFFGGLLFSGPGHCERPTAITGKLTTGAGKTPVVGAVVKAWPVGEALTGEAPHVAAETAQDGHFRLSLPPGDYFVLAEGAGLYAFYGRNPLNVPDGGVAGLNLSMISREVPPAHIDARVETGFLGRLTHDGKPLEGAIVTVYADARGAFRGMGLGWAAPTDAAGFFEAPLPPGSYYLVARKRNGEHLRGPLQAGDFFGYFPDNPVRIREGKVVDVSFALVEIPEKIRLQGEEMFGDTSIRGQVLDGTGQTVAGVKVMLYGDPMMMQRPLYVSHPTNKKGEFVLSFPRGGRYWLVARDDLGGHPRPGQFYGRYSDSLDGSIYIRTGQKFEGVRIRGEILN